MNRVVFAFVAILFLLSVSSITGLIQTVKAESAPITINEDGSITPSTAPIYTADNITYTLTGNINIISDTNGIVIERDNIILNGAGYTVSGSGNVNGVVLANMGNVTVRNMMITNFSDGIQLASSSNNTLSGNNVANNEFGIYLDSSSDNNTISNNNITANSQSGIVLDTSSNYNTLSGNNITANIGAGIWLYSSSKNTIYHNNFNNNTNQVYSYDSTNVWDNGSVGNYWSDYLTRYPNAAQVDSSGVWNAPYVIDANNTDYYPLVGPIGVIPEFQSFLILPLMMMATLLAVIIYKKKGVKTSQS